MEKESNNNSAFLKRYDTVLAFLGVEIIALILFGFGGSTGLMILKILGFGLSIIAYPFLEAAYDKKTLTRMALVLLPLALLFILIGISNFWIAYYSDNVFTGMLSGLLEAVSLLGAFLLGFSLKNIPALKREYFVFGILAGLVLLTLLTGIYSLARYGFFYSAKYAGKVYYFDGVIFPIATETKILDGFSFAEVSLRYGKIAAFVLACSGAGLFFVKKDSKKKHVLVLAGAALIGILDLVFVPYTNALILLVLVYGITGIIAICRYALRNKEKAASRLAMIAWILAIAAMAIGAGLFILDGLTDCLVNAGIPKISDSLKSGDGLGSIRKAVQSVLYGNPEKAELKQFSFSTILFGFKPTSSVNLTNSMEFNILYENGMLAFLLLLVVIGASMYGIYKYLRKTGLDYSNGVVLSLILGLFIYMSLNIEEMPFVHATGFKAVTREGCFYGLFALLGYCFEPSAFSKKKIGEEKKGEANA